MIKKGHNAKVRLRRLIPAGIVALYLACLCAVPFVIVLLAAALIIKWVF